MSIPFCSRPFYLYNLFSLKRKYYVCEGKLLRNRTWLMCPYLTITCTRNSHRPSLTENVVSIAHVSGGDLRIGWAVLLIFAGPVHTTGGQLAIAWSRWLDMTRVTLPLPSFLTSSSRLAQRYSHGDVQGVRSKPQMPFSRLRLCQVS